MCAARSWSAVYSAGAGNEILDHTVTHLPLTFRAVGFQSSTPLGTAFANLPYAGPGSGIAAYAYSTQTRASNMAVNLEFGLQQAHICYSPATAEGLKSMSQAVGQAVRGMCCALEKGSTALGTLSGL